MQDIAVSVIIPVYNTERFLRECLDSIRAQTLDNIEIICIDDGSTDSSLEILNAYSLIDPRITVVSQSNAGAGAARNKGLRMSRGKYLSFLDADDFFEPTMFEKAYSQAEREHAEIVMYHANFYDNTQCSFSAGYNVNEWMMPSHRPFAGTEVQKDTFHITIGWAWDKLFLSDFIRENNIYFQEQRTTNDLLFVFSALVKAKRITTLPDILAHQRINVSTSLSVTREKSWQCFYNALIAFRDQLKSWELYEHFERDYINYALSFALWNISTLKKPASTELYYKLRYEWFKELGIEDCPKDMFYNQAEYAQYQMIMHYSSDTVYKVLYDNRDLSHCPKVSVVIPMHNVEKYLRECLDSVVNQTLHDVEIICVDNGSTDNTLSIAKDYCNDNRFVLLSQSDKGISSARNLGIKYTRGEYIHFLDSDDYMRFDAYESLYEKATEQSLDMLCFSCEVICNKPEVGDFAKRYTPPYRYGSDISVTSGEQLFCIFQKAHVNFANACMTVYKRDYLQKLGIAFVEGIVHEDEAFTFEVMLSAQRIAYTTSAFHFRRLRVGSIMTSPISFSRVRGYLTAYFHMCDFALRNRFSFEAQECIDARLEGIRSLIFSLRGSVPTSDEGTRIYERTILNNISPLELAQYKNEVDCLRTEADSLRSELEILRIERDNYCNELDRTRASRSFRIGRIATYPLRKARGFVRCLREHGVKYTCRRVLIHLHLYREKEPVIKDYNYYQNLPPR